MARKGLLEPTSNELAIRGLSKMNYRDMQKACVLKGADFDFVVSKGAPTLAQWYIDHFDNAEDPKLLDEFDDWMEKKLIERGYKKGDAMLHPSFRFGYTEKFDESEAKPKPSESKVEKPIKEKREKDDSGMFKGTKKALTKECAAKKMSLEKTIALVMDKFPDANPKSLKIWFKKFGGKD